MNLDGAKAMSFIAISFIAILAREQTKQLILVLRVAISLSTFYFIISKSKNIFIEYHSIGNTFIEIGEELFNVSEV